jgi:cellulose synthase/poly-beta-1,6-N-acetylglucosamine synthase-like glycosyltransferase
MASASNCDSLQIGSCPGPRLIAWRATELHADSLTWLQLLAPTIFVLGAIYLFGSLLPMARPWARFVVFATVWPVVAWYLHWRLFASVLPAEGSAHELAWIWLCFAVELFAIVDQFILYLAFLRRTDHSAEADRHEARLRAMRADELPSVDVFIPTYNEPIEVLEKTITGALCLDYPNVNVWVLDDGRRPWLKAFCESKGAGYLNRPDNAHAKAGNINHALMQTNAEFVAIFDADFVPQRNFLIRTIGFFSDPEVGIVQVPHAFYNHDPLQVSLAAQKSLPDEQRLFFDAIMPSRDGWNAAFCCGSNSVTRRAALRAIGDALPTDSITEDILLTMTLLRKGYVTRYLCERLAFGLAPETVDAFFVQRQRWARGAMQLLYLPNGPFGRGLTVMQRLLFLPTHWLSLGLRSSFALVVPIVFLLTGLSPVYDLTPADLIYYFIPMLLALAGGVRLFAPQQYFPLASLVYGTFLSFKVLPTVLQTLVKPFGHPFKVTPKGRGQQASTYARGIFWTSASLMGLTILGLIINTIPEWRVLDTVEVLPIVAAWSAINVFTLFMVCMTSLQGPVRRGEERFELDLPIWILTRGRPITRAQISDISLSGVSVEQDEGAAPYEVGDVISVFLTEVGFIAGSVVRQDGPMLAVKFDLPPSLERDLLIRKLLTAGHDTKNVNTSSLSASRAMIKSIWSMRTDMQSANTPVASSATPADKLPAQSLTIQPRPQALSLSELSESRRALAA